MLRNKHFFYRTASLLFLVLVAALLLHGIRGVEAQGETALAIEPGNTSVAIGSTVEINVIVQNGVDLAGYDLTVEYDAEVVTLESWSHGDYLSNLAVVKKIDQPGSFRLVATQLATPGVSGDGTLLSLTFFGNVQGNSAVELVDTSLADENSELIIPFVKDGLISVTETSTPAFTNTPTSTNSATFTTSPTSTNTPTMTLTRTTQPLLTWTPTRTRTPTPVTGLTVTPIRAIVVTATGTPGTAVVVQPGTRPDEPAPIAQGTKPAVGGIGGVSVTVPADVSKTLVSDGIEQTVPDVPEESDENNGNKFTAVEKNGAINDVIEKINRTNSLLWGGGLLILVVLAGLVFAFLKLWKS